MLRKTLLFSTVLALAACSVTAEDPAESGAESRLDSVPTIRFGADWSVTTTGVAMTGRKLKIDYDTGRMPTCRGDVNGGPGWTVTGFARVNGGEPKTFTAAGHSPTGQLDNVIDLPGAAGDADLEIWFQNTSRWGCQAWDSNYGKNYHFTARPAPNAPGWLGNVLFVSERQTCGGGACESDRKPLQNATFTYDTWTRQRAAVTQLTFQVWKQGVTDWDNPNTWRDLDVQMHYRWRANAPFSHRYVNIDRHVGNDVRYVVDARQLDPMLRYGSYPQKKDECPDVDMQASTQSGYAEATIEFYFTVNGVELRPGSGQTFHGRYLDYAQAWAVCTQ